MSNLISRKEMIRAVDSLGEDYISYYKLLMLICRLPSAEQETAKVKKQGKVYESSDHMFAYETWGECGNCGEPVKQGVNYCSWCGMKLDWDKDGDE